MLLNPFLSAVNYVPYTQDIRNIYVRYTQDNRVINLRTPYLPLVFPLPSACFFPLSFSKPPRYHFNTTPLPLYYHPILFPSLPPTLYTFYLSVFTFQLKNLHIRKFYCTFATESYAGGKYVLRKAFRKGSFFGQVSDIFKQRLLTLCV